LQKVEKKLLYVDEFDDNALGRDMPEWICAPSILCQHKRSYIKGAVIFPEPTSAAIAFKISLGGTIFKQSLKK
jgi:hypothetical protein